MRLSIVAVGRMKAGPESELAGRYVERVARSGRQIGITACSVREIVESRHASVSARMEDEAARLLGGIQTGAFLVGLDERGEDLDSTAFAAMLRGCLQGGTAEMRFMIGGPDGHGEAARRAAQRLVRFGRMTWPHQLVRILLAEQLYRAVTILSGHPYHRASQD